MNAFKAIGSWFRWLFEVIKRVEEAEDFNFENYARERFKKLEERVAALEGRPRNH